MKAGCGFRGNGGGQHPVILARLCRHAVLNRASAQAAYNIPMSNLNLKALDPAELLPLPAAASDSCAPRDEEERRIFALVREGIESGPGVLYPNAAAFAAEFAAQLPRILKR